MPETIEIVVPRGGVQLLLAQRGQYRPALFRVLRRLSGRRFYHSHLRSLEQYASLRRMQRRYGRELRETYESFAGLLPPRLTRVLDIGAGMAGINAITYREHGGPELWLLDKDGVSPEIRNGYHASAETFAHYHSFQLAIDLLSMNGVDPDRIRTVDIARQPFPDETFDLIHSFLSWGFHYPLETYLDAAHEALRPSGVMVLDARRGQGGEACLARKFAQEPRIVHEDPKFIRCAVVKR